MGKKKNKENKIVTVTTLNAVDNKVSFEPSLRSQYLQAFIS